MISKKGFDISPFLAGIETMKDSDSLIVGVDKGARAKDQFPN